MNIEKGARAPIRHLTLFILLAGIPMAALGWAGWRVLEHDRALEANELQKRLNDAGSLAAREIDRGLSTWEERLTAAAEGDPSGIPPGTAVLLFDSKGIRTRRGAVLPYYPRVALRDEAPEDIFEEAWEKEFRSGRASLAAPFYRELTKSPDPRVRAGALMRLARCLSGAPPFDEALKASAALAEMGDMPVKNDPAELAARRLRIALFQKIGDIAAKDRERALLRSALAEGRFAIDHVTYDAYSELLAEPPAAPAEPLAQAVEALWPIWQQQPGGRQAWTNDAGAQGFAAVWRTKPEGTTALIGSVDTLMQPVAAVIHESDYRLALTGASGEILWGSVLSGGASASQILRESGLPWTLHISIGNQPVGAASAARRNVVAASFGLMALVIAAASYFVFRALTREFRVAQLQSDFVSAVSHEFRTPLAAMRHLTDLLEDGGVPTDGLTRCYGALGKETRRLHEMVESLLDFARMDSGRRAYEMDEANVAELAGALVNEFRETRHLSPDRVEFRPPQSQPRIRGDRDALSLALRNLLDNAVKYSPETSTVSVSVECREGLAGIAVEDHGSGIAREDQRDIFHKFVRGPAARKLHVKGTGIGLTMADQIVKAHGGRIELDSEPDRGSRFTILLPLAAGTASEKENTHEEDSRRR